MRWLPPLLIIFSLLLLWQSVVWLTSIPRFILPEPLSVLSTLYDQSQSLSTHALVTLKAIILGMALGIGLGLVVAMLMVNSMWLERLLMPLLLFSQSIPFFALAPILVLWLGFGISSKVAMVMIMIFVPVTSTFFDGLSNTNPALLDLARVVRAKPWRLFWLIKLPSALPSLGTGLKLAAIYSPVGAIIGEWIGGSEGLGYIMLRANGEGRIDLMFAGLILLLVMTWCLVWITSLIARRLTRFANYGAGFSIKMFLST